jgi:hypothetical protein
MTRHPVDAEPLNRVARVAAGSGGSGMADATRHGVRIRVGGTLGSASTGWFDDLTVTDAGDGTTVLEGDVVDQAALHGILDRIRDLGLALVAVETSVPVGIPAPAANEDIGGS